MLRFTSALALLILAAACTGSAEDSSSAAEPAAAAPQPAAMLNANLAVRSELEQAVGEAVAAALMDARPLLTLTAVYNAVLHVVGEEDAQDVLASVSVPINLNDASREEILLIPGVGERMAHEFEEYRPYVAIEQFRREIGKYVDDDEVARLEQFVFVPVNLNAASDEAILAIPGVGNRMLHEFKEYRPYQEMAQFRREIGKYVDDRELARLERFVTL